MEATMTTQEQVTACLRYLAGQCDGASSKDGHGFNKLDSQFGHDLAMQAHLTRNQMVAATRMLKKYSKQLEVAGLVVPMVAEAAKEQETTVKEDNSMEENMIVLTGQMSTIPDVEPIESETKSTDIVLSAEQQAVLKVMEETRNHIFITGFAGTGKSVLFRTFRKLTKKKIVVVAPTGIAALNVEAATIHSTFKLPPQLHQPGRLEKNPRCCSLLEKVDTIMIDEISMVRADLLDAVDERMREAKRNNIPFGGAQVIMSGDMYQLPPVVADDDLQKYLEAVHGGPFFFNALVWKNAEFKIYELTQIFRQKDPIFKDVLNAVRDGSVNDEQIAQLNARCVPIPVEGTVTLAPTNNLVTRINQERLDRLPGRMYTYRAMITGTMKKSVFPTEEYLQLKQGAQVVLLKNDKDGRWVNGTVGKIEKLSDTAIEILVDGISYTLERETWEEIAYTYDHTTQKVEAEVVSSFTQYPIRLAWALTIHKSQGQTYESVALDLTTATFAAGQLYVALSRATSLEGLYLKMPVKRAHIIVDAKVAAFMARRETITIEAVEEAQAVVVEEFHSEIAPEPIIETTIEEVTTEPTTVKTLDLPTTKNKGGSGHKSELSVKVAYKFSADVAKKLNKLAEETGVNKSAFIDGLLAKWFEEHGM